MGDVVNRQQKRPPYVRPPSLVPWTQMGRREVLFACLLAMRAASTFGDRWSFDHRNFSYDPASDVVVVTVPYVGETWAMVRFDEQRSADEIKRQFGVVGWATASQILRQVG